MTCDVMDLPRGGQDDGAVTTKEPAMSIFASPVFLRRVLWADAASCIACGALQLAALDALPHLLGLPQPLLAATGVFLVGYAAVVAWIASRPVLPRALVALCAIGNFGWAAGCAAAVAWLQPPALGIAWIGMQGLCVVVLAELQWLALRAGRRGGSLQAA